MCARTIAARTAPAPAGLLVMRLVCTCSSCISSSPAARASQSFLAAHAAYVRAAVVAAAADVVAVLAAVPVARPTYWRLLLVSSHTHPRCVFGVPLAALM